MNNFILHLLLLFFLPISLNGQKQLSQNFKFESGVYLTFEAFQANSPTYKAADIGSNFFINETTKQAKVEYIQLKATNQKLDLTKIWGIVIKGIPYLKVAPNLPVHSLKVFAAMEVRGNICYFAYDDREEKNIPFKVYNPLLGIPFRTSTVKRTIPVIKEKMLQFETGAIVDFNYQNIIEWLSHDKDIVKALKSLGPARAEEKLFDALLLYNERYPIELK